MSHSFNLIIILLLTKLASAQSTTSKDLSALQKGLFINSSNILIPWKSRLSDTAAIGRPKINRRSEKNIEADWGLVEVLDGIVLPLKGYFRKVHGDWHLIYFYSSIDSANMGEIKSSLESCFEKNGAYNGTKEDYFHYQWKLYNCMVRIGRFPKEERFWPLNGHYVWIQKL
jgi:hypothetical protein